MYRQARMIEASVLTPSPRTAGSYAAGMRLAPAATDANAVSVVTKPDATSETMTVTGTYVGDRTRNYTVTVSAVEPLPDTAGIYAITQVRVTTDADGGVEKVYAIGADHKVFLGEAIGLTLVFDKDGTTTGGGDTYTFTATAAQCMKFAAALGPSSPCRITGARLMTQYNAATDITTNVRFRLHLYKYNIGGLAGDAVLYKILQANRTAEIGYLDFPPTITADTATSDCVIAQLSNINLDFEGGAGETSFYGALETRDAFTPIANQRIYIDLTVE